MPESDMAFWSEQRAKNEEAREPPKMRGRTDEQKMDEMMHTFDLRRFYQPCQLELYQEIMRFRREFG
jgi:hypothetical protein